MSNKLEDRLHEIEKITPIQSDVELTGALRRIIKEESAKINEDNVGLISEAAELLMNIEGVSDETLEQGSALLFTEFMLEKKSCSVSAGNKNRFCYTAMKKVAVFALLIVSAAVILASFNGEVRAAVKNTFVTWMRELAIIDFTAEESVETEEETAFSTLSAIGSFELETYPSGFTLESEKNDDKSKLYRFKNGNDFIVLEVIPTDPAGIIHSTENHKYSEVMIGDTLGYLFYNEEERSGSVIFGNSKVTVIIGGVADRNVLIEFAREIEK